MTKGLCLGVDNVPKPVYRVVSQVLWPNVTLTSLTNVNIDKNKNNNDNV